MQNQLWPLTWYLKLAVLLKTLKRETPKQILKTSDKIEMMTIK